MVAPALLIAGHGSRDAEGAQEFRDLVALTQKMTAFDVSGGFIELSPPSIAAAAEELVSKGNRDIVVIPLMLLAAGHTKGDIPATIERERARHPGVRFRYGRDLGLHPTILEMLDDRIETAHPKPRSASRGLLVGRGSSDPDANGDVAKLARLIQERHGFASVELAFTGITGPTVAEGLDRCRRLGPESIIVIPHFLFTGVLERRIREESAAFREQEPDRATIVAPYLGPEERVAELVLERYREAIEGDPKMNCDLCVYRVRFTGLEDRVGAPAFPHHHPDEGDHRHEHGHAHESERALQR